MRPLFEIIIITVSFSLSGLLLVYGLCFPSKKIQVFSLAVGINIFPFIFCPWQMLRVAGIPVTYFSFIAAALVLGLSTGVKVPKRDAGLFFLCVSFILYTSFTTFNHGFTILNFTNYLAWPFNFCLFFVAYRYFLAENRKKVDTAIESLFWILVYGCFVGLFRKFNGIALDANFMPIISRNGTVVFMVMVAPLLFYMQENNKIGAGKTIFIWLLFFITLTQIESRSGVIGFVFSTHL